MDSDNVWSDHKYESSKTTEQWSPYFCNISASTNPAYYNVPHHGSPEFPSYNKYLAKPCHGNMNSCYSQGNAMEHGNFKKFFCTQPCNTAMKRKNCSQMQPKGVRPQGQSMKSNRKKKLNSKQNKDHFSGRPQFINYIHTENNNQQKKFDNRANIYNSIPRSQLLSTGNVANKNNVLLKGCSSTEKNLQYLSLGTNQTHFQHSSASGNQTNASTNFNMNDALLRAASGTNRLGLDFDTGASIYFQEENITNFADEDSSVSNQFNAFDDVLTKSIPDVDRTKPLDQAQFLDAPKGNLLLNAQKTTNPVKHNNADADGEEQIFTLKTICEGKNESGKDVILLLAVPEAQRQISQEDGSVDSTICVSTLLSEENTSTRAGARENTVVGNENNLQCVQNNTVENSQEVEEMNDDSNATFTSNPAEFLGHKFAVKTSGCRKRKCRTASANTQLQYKKCNTINSEAETTGLEGSSQMNLNEMHSCQPRYRRSNPNCRTWRARLKWRNNSNSFKRLQNQYFGQFAKKYFKEKRIHDRELQELMRVMLSRVGGSVMNSICCFFETLKRNYNARMHN